MACQAIRGTNKEFIVAQIPTAGYGLPQRATRRSVTLSGGDISALTQPTREIGNLGATIAGFGAKFAEETLEANAQRELANFKGFIREQDNALEQLAAENDDYNLYEPAAQQGFKNIDEFAAGLGRRGQAAAKNYWAQVKPLYEGKVGQLIKSGMDDKASADGFANIAKIIAEKDFTTDAAITTNEMRNATGKGASTVSETDAKLLEIQKIVNANVKANVWSHKQGQAIMAGSMDKIKAVNEMVKVDTIKNDLIAVLGDTYDKEVGYELLDEYYKKGVITAEQNKVIGDWMDSYASGRVKKAENDRHAAHIKNYKDFSRKLTTADVSYDDIESAGFDKDIKELWQTWVKGSFDPAPAAATYQGINDAVGAVMDFNTLAISRESAYKKIMNARFTDKSITDDDYTWALSRIDNPYPKHVAENTRAIMNATEKYYHYKGTGFFFDWIDAQEKQQLTARKKAFLSWLDDEIEGGKYPGGKDMFAKMKEMDALSEEPIAAPGGMYGHSAAPPDPKDPLYITTDEQYDKIPEETAFYDGLTGRWLYKPKKGQPEKAAKIPSTLKGMKQLSKVLIG